METPFPVRLYLRRPSCHRSTNSTPSEVGEDDRFTSAMGMLPFNFELKISTERTRTPPEDQVR
jgi:hypothetical protein